MYVIKRKISFESVNVALNFAVKGGFAFKFDLKNGYHHISIHESQREFLGFSFPDSKGKVRYLFLLQCLLV